jgi:hypothetical protein
MKRTAGFLFPVILLIATISAQAQIPGSAICPDNLTYGTRSVRGSSPDNLFSSENSPFASRDGLIAAPEYSPVLMNATSLGAGAVGDIPLHNDIFLRISIINLFTPAFGRSVSGYASQGMLMPVEVGVRIPFLRSELGTLGYSLYGESSAGLLFGWAFPTNGSFLNYSLTNSRFTSGASAYIGIGNSLRVDRYVGVYLNGGMGYYDLFSHSFMPQTRYLVPSVSVGFLFNFTRS